MSNASLPILYSFKRCPYAIRARVALAFAQVDYIHREINLRDKHSEFLKTSPKGTVPVLVDSENKPRFAEIKQLSTYEAELNFCYCEISQRLLQRFLQEIGRYYPHHNQ